MLWTIGTVTETRISAQQASSLASSKQLPPNASPGSCETQAGPPPCRTPLSPSPSPTGYSTYIKLGSGGTIDPTKFSTPTDTVSSTASNVPCSEDPYCYYSLTWSRTTEYLLIYHIFGFLWTTQFIIGGSALGALLGRSRPPWRATSPSSDHATPLCTGFGYTCLAGAIATFYWARGDRSVMPARPLMSSVRRTIRYHLGSIALGSFIIAIVQFIRLVLEYIDQKTKTAQGQNKLLKLFMYCAKYCMWYIEQVLKFINRRVHAPLPRCVPARALPLPGWAPCSGPFRCLASLVEGARRA